MSVVHHGGNTGVQCLQSARVLAQQHVLYAVGTGIRHPAREQVLHQRPIGRYMPYVALPDMTMAVDKPRQGNHAVSVDDFGAFCGEVFTHGQYL